MSERKINVEVSTAEVKDLLLKNLHGKDASEVADIIIGQLLLTPVGIPQLFKGLLGIFPSLEYEVGDFIWVKLDYLSSWKVDKEKTKALPNYRDGYLLCQISETNVYKGSPYKVAYDIIRSGYETLSPEVYDIEASSIKEKAEDFTDILDLLEEIKAKGPDLPF